MSKLYKKNIVARSWRDINVVKFSEENSSEYFHNFTVGTAVVKCVLTNGRTLKMSLRVSGEGAGERVCDLAEYRIGKITLVKKGGWWESDVKPAIEEISRRYGTTTGCIYNILFNAMYFVMEYAWDRKQLVEIPDYTIDIQDFYIDPEKIEPGKFEFSGSADVNFDEFTIKIDISREDFGDFGYVILATVRHDGRTFQINYGTADSLAIPSPWRRFNDVRETEKSIGIPAGSLMFIIRDVYTELWDSCEKYYFQHYAE